MSIPEPSFSDFTPQGLAEAVNQRGKKYVTVEDTKRDPRRKAPFKASHVTLSHKKYARPLEVSKCGNPMTTDIARIMGYEDTLQKVPDGRVVIMRRGVVLELRVNRDYAKCRLAKLS